MSVCVITMVYRDYWFLRRWYAHYGAQVGHRNLVVVSHGDDPEHRRIAPEAGFIALPRGDLADFDARRGDLLNALARGLSGYHDFVLRVDVDEFLVADPALHAGLEPCLAAHAGPAYFALGFDLYHAADEPDLAPDDPILRHRRFALPNSVYCKAVGFREPRDFFRHGLRLDRADVAEEPFCLPRGLYLFHLKYVSRPLAAETGAQRQAVVDQGHAKHGRNVVSRIWNNTALRQDQFFDKAEALPVLEGDAGLDRAHREFAQDPVRRARRKYGLLKVRNAEVAARVALPDRLRDLF